jgi:polyisoprenoid-binding protein YceI
MKYRVGAGSKLLVQAKSRIHDTSTVWSKVEGDVEADPETLATAGARATFKVDMTTFDAGDFLRNRKLRKDFEMEAHPTATFELTGVRDVVRTGSEFTATGDGTLRWRGREVALAIAGKGTLDARGLAATGTFVLDIRRLGLSAPRFLMFKMEDEVEVEVTLRGEAVP